MGLQRLLGILIVIVQQKNVYSPVCCDSLFLFSKQVKALQIHKVYLITSVFYAV